MKRLVSMILLFGLSLPVQAQDTPHPLALRGRWIGTVIPSPSFVRAREKLGVYSMHGDGTAKYQMELTITKLVEHDYAGSVWYPIAGCTNALLFVHFLDGTFYFQEVAQNQKMRCPGGMIQVRLVSDDEVQWVFFYRHHTKEPASNASLIRLYPLGTQHGVEQQ